MKKKILSLIAISIITITVAFATKHTIVDQNFKFLPDILSIQVGDTVVWDLANIHTVVEVDSTVWMNNGNTSNNGFQHPAGGGTTIFQTPGKYYYVCGPHASGGMKGTLTVLAPTSINELDLVNTFNFYPNPTRDIVTINLNEGSNFEKYIVQDLNGKTILLDQVASTKIQLNVKNYPKGIYFISLSNANGILTKKLIVL